MQMCPVSESTTSNNQVIDQPASWNGLPIHEMLTSQEQASGCRMYRIANTCPKMGVQSGDLVVALPVALADWTAIQAGEHYIINEQIPAFENPNGWIEPAYEAEQLIQVNGLAKKRSFPALVESGDGTVDETTYRYSNLLEMHRLIRLVRPFGL